MKIYFSGIGGVGIGPLAEIAQDAGHEVHGSDQAAGLMTEELAARGIAISLDQSGAALRAEHEKAAIDWFVYTSALPDDHPELVAAQRLGIRTGKRDELLAEIIRDENLKLIAIAGTHGKTTTTGMMIWTLQQLGIPVSYSVGSTLSFGPSGKFDPKSDYFVYECDEFDRNFLHFQPWLSLITSIDYDHPDTYPTEAEYLAAFEQFIAQSAQCVAWRQDVDEMTMDGVQLLDKTADSTQAALKTIALAGQHNRENGLLVLAALEQLGATTADALAATASFPGTRRRFEKLADNLYSDYGHHPTEIAATLQMARELNNQVVLVYQPHQNIRQHEVQHLYTDCTVLADTVYWLPTYLTREDPDLPILSPEELTADLHNREAVRFTELNDELWQTITRERAAGKLVLCMGAGTIDGWVRDRLKRPA